MQRICSCLVQKVFCNFGMIYDHIAIYKGYKDNGLKGVRMIWLAYRH